MFGPSKVFGGGIFVVLTLVALALGGGITNLQATPICATPIVLPTGNGTIDNSNLGDGVCVQSQDKIFGDFNFGNVPPGSVTFRANPTGKRHSITFNAPFAPGVTYNNGFEVEAIGGILIAQMNADITQTEGGPTTLMQTTTPTPNSGSIDFNKTGNVVSGPFQVFFTPAQDVTDMVVTGTLTMGPNSDASAILDTIVESLPVRLLNLFALELLGVALTGFGGFGLRRKSRPGEAGPQPS